MVRHNEIHDITANLLTEVCHDVQIEPCLQPLTGESLAGASSNMSDGARLDIAAVVLRVPPSYEEATTCRAYDIETNR